MRECRRVTSRDNQINGCDEKITTCARERKQDKRHTVERSVSNSTRARGLKSYLSLGGGHNSLRLFPSRARTLAPPEYFNIGGGWQPGWFCAWMGLGWDTRHATHTHTHMRERALARNTNTQTHRYTRTHVYRIECRRVGGWDGVRNSTQLTAVPSVGRPGRWGGFSLVAPLL